MKIKVSESLYKKRAENKMVESHSTLKLPIVEDKINAGSNKIKVGLTRKMTKDYYSLLDLVVQIDEIKKEQYIEKAISDQEEYLKSSGEKQIERKLSAYKNKLQELIKEAISEILAKGVDVSSSGSVSVSHSWSSEYDFIEVKILSRGREINELSEIDNWQYDDSEIVIHGEKYFKF